MDIYLAEPRGFCAGVTRALKIVNETRQQFGAPIYVRHEIVHNKHIIEDLKKQGVIFIEELSEIEDLSRPVIFSAHGVSKKIKDSAKKMNLKIIDATCPLVEAVHHQIRKLEEQGAEIIVIGKATHPEIQGTVGQLKNPQKVHLISTLKEAQNLAIPEKSSLGIVTQTTLSVLETMETISCLRKKHKNIINASRPNICFATTHRQQAVQKLIEYTKQILIIGSKNSSNSQHLKEAAINYGAQQAWLVDDVSEVDWSKIDDHQSLGISAGASAPEYLIENLLEALKTRYHNINLHHVKVAEEHINL